MDKNDIVGVVKAALSVIQTEQESDGGFVTFSSAHAKTFTDERRYQTTFAAANILHGLNVAQSLFPSAASLFPNLQDVARHAVEFLIAQRSELWSFNYWSRTADERKTMPYPDDLDDTFAALTALHEFDPQLIDGAVLAAVSRLLIAAEVKPGGPYRTWLIGPDAAPVWRDIDPVVNGDIGAFLERFDVHMPGITDFIETAIKGGKLTSSYYPSVCHAAYFISRFYRGSEKGIVLTMIFDERCEDGLWATPLETAMAFSALVNLGFADSIAGRDIEAFVESIQKDDFAPYPFCIDPSRDGKRCYAGSRALTAAFTMEALAKWLMAHEKVGIGARNTATGSAGAIEGGKILQKIKVHVLDECRHAPQSLRHVVHECIEKVEDEEIVLLPYRMRGALGSGTDIASDAGVLEYLATGNLYGWMAYGIYDDFLDGEGDPRLLPAANFFLRQAVLCYREMGCVISNFDGWCDRLIAAVDNANIWEIEHCRWPAGAVEPAISRVSMDEFHNRFAARSIAHALSALGVILFTDLEKTDRDAKAFLSFFRHYLIARQLHDDAHDWADDLSRGRLTPVGAQIVGAWHDKHPNASLDISAVLPEMRRIFWRGEIQSVVKEIKRHTRKARWALARVRAVKNPGALTPLLDRLDVAADRVLARRDDALKFLEAYAQGKT